MNGKLISDARRVLVQQIRESPDDRRLVYWEAVLDDLEGTNLDRVRELVGRHAARRVFCSPDEFDTEMRDVSPFLPGISEFETWMGRKRIVFLDIDGVLNGLQQRTRLTGALDKDCCQRVARLVREADADIVIHSMWRYSYDFGPLQEMLGKSGIPRDRIKSAVILWGYRRTVADDPRERSYSIDNRGALIDAWLQHMKAVGSKYVILDDEGATFDERHPLVLTDTLFGITDWDVERATKLLLGA